MKEKSRTRLRRHLQVIDTDVEPVVQRYRAHIECAQGCSDCCQQTFRVSHLEGAYLREGLLALPDDTRADILARARDYTPDERQPCPVLSAKGACRMYAHRPRICRKYGIPLWNPERPDRVDTCPKNFRDVADIDAGLIVDPQARWAEAWIDIRDEEDTARTTDTIAAHLQQALTDDA
ncbi:MAG: YkgJ family cysteine cluster protein [Nannocystaceae bacterium]|nr:YkgJ family cysteine cluster protein [Nannocystaceae bacterium]